MNKDFSLSEHYTQADKLMLGVNYGLIVYSLLLAPWYNTWAEAIIVSVLTGLSLTAIFYLVPGSVIARVAMSTGFMVMSALHIHQGHGMIEIHFGIFVLLAILLYYRDWLPIVTAAAVIAVHHLLFYYFQSNGSSLWVISDTDNGWWVIFMHAGYVVAESALLIWLAKTLRNEAIQSLEIMSLTNHIAAEDCIDLRLRSSASTPLLKRFDGYTQQVEQLAIQVRHATEQLSEEGANLADITEQMNTAAQTQQQETDMIATAVEQMSHAVDEVSRNAEDAATAAGQIDCSAKEATQVSEKTQSAVEMLAQQINQAAQTIGVLNDHSKRISSVLDVIRGIAEQTNLLALNAAIEAARAGEQGRGFAVVADEVRTLAQRTQKSTEEIDQMIDALQAGSESAVAVIGSSSTHAEDCVLNTRESLTLMEQVSQSIQEINRMNTMIATASAEQSSVVAEVSNNLSNIVKASNVTTEDTAKAADAGASLRSISESLSSVIQRFKLTQ